MNGEITRGFRNSSQMLLQYSTRWELLLWLYYWTRQTTNWNSI